MVTTYDPSAPATGLPSFANDSMSSAEDQMVPMETDDAALADGDQADEAASETADTPFDLGSLDDTQRQYLDSVYQTQYENRFREQLSQAMSSRDRENNELRGHVQGLQGQYAATQAALNRVLAWQAQQAQESGNELQFYQLRDEAMNALTTTQAQFQQSQQQVASWVEGQFHTINRLANEKAVDSTGQRLFDPADPEIVSARDEFLRAAHRDLTSRRPDGTPNPATSAQAMNAQRNLEQLWERKREAALRGVQQGERAKKVKQSNDAIANRQSRGPQATGRAASGGGGAMTDAQAWEQATKEYPDQSDYMSKRFPRYLQLTSAVKR